MISLLTPLLSAALTGLLPLAAHDKPHRAAGERPAPADVDPGLTDEIRHLEQEFGDAIVRADVGALERMVGPEYTLRISDFPQQSLPRAMWMDNTLHRLKAESFEQRDDAARRLADDLAVVSLVFTQKASMSGRDFSGQSYLVDFWKKRAGGWQIIARYGSRLRHEPRRPPLPLPPPTDTDPQLTEQLRPLEEALGEVARHGFKDARTMERLVGPEFTARCAEAPEISVPRRLWGQPSSACQVEALEERDHAARRLTDDVAVVSLALTRGATGGGGDRGPEPYLVDVWKKRGDRWQIVARHSGLQGQTPDPSPRP